MVDEDLIAHLEATGLNPVVFPENPPPTPLPFLPGTRVQYAWDSTSLGYFKTCPRLYYYQMIEGWQQKEDSVHLRFGIEYHQALHDYELSRGIGVGHQDAVHDTIRALLERCGDYPKIDSFMKKSIRMKTKANLVRTVVWYLDKFFEDPIQTIGLGDGKPAMEVSFKFELDWGPGIRSGGEMQYMKHPTDPQAIVEFKQPYLLCGHLDRVVNFNSDIFVMDRKTTTSSLSDYYFSQFEPNNQMTLYTLAGQVVLGAPIKGVIIDAASIGEHGSDFQRGFTFRTNDQINEWLEDLKVLLASAEACATSGYYPMNDTACDKFGGCRFREVCSRSPGVRPNLLKADFVKGEPWNPLVPRG